MIASPIGGNRPRADRSPNVQVVDLNFRTPSILQVRKITLDISVHLLVIRVRVEQICTSLVVETIRKVDPTVGEVLIPVGFAFADTAIVAFVAKSKAHDRMVLLVCRHREMHAGIVVIVEVENRAHGALCQFHASQPWVVVWNKSIQGHWQLE